MEYWGVGVLGKWSAGARGTLEFPNTPILHHSSLPFSQSYCSLYGSREIRV